MPTQENGIAGNDPAPAELSIASTTDATPIAVTTSTPHGLTTGDVVYIYDHQTNYHANIRGPVTVTGASAFTLDGTTATGAGAGGATGKVQSLVFASTYAIPSDGTDDADAASVNVALEALGDRTAKLATLNLGLVRFVDSGHRGPRAIKDYLTLSHDDLTGTITASTATSAGVWTALGAPYVLGTIDRLLTKDNVLLRLSCNLISSSAGVPFITIGAREYHPGATPGAFTPILAGTPQAVLNDALLSPALGASAPAGYHLQGVWNAFAAVLGGGSLDLCVMGYSSSGAGSASLVGGWRLEALVLR